MARRASRCLVSRVFNGHWNTYWCLNVALHDSNISMDFWVCSLAMFMYIMWLPHTFGNQKSHVLCTQKLLPKHSYLKVAKWLSWHLFQFKQNKLGSRRAQILHCSCLCVALKLNSDLSTQCPETAQEGESAAPHQSPRTLDPKQQSTFKTNFRIFNFLQTKFQNASHLNKF